MSANLVELVDLVYEISIVKEEQIEGYKTITDAEAALRSSEFKRFLLATSELEKVEIMSLTRDEKVAFFLNIYQCMYIHYFLSVKCGRLAEDD